MKLNRFLLTAALAGAVVFVGCKKDSDDSTPSLNAQSDPQVEFKIDGTALSFKDGANDVSTYFSNSGGLNPFPDTSESVYGAGFAKNGGSDPILEISKGTNKFVGATDSANFCAFFKKKAYSYSIDAVDGIMISYYDDAGTLWSTALSGGGQSGSTFTIDDNHYMTLFGDKYIRIKASFSCKVYDGSGASKSITNGVAVLDYWADY